MNTHIKTLSKYDIVYFIDSKDQSLSVGIVHKNMNDDNIMVQTSQSIFNKVLRRFKRYELFPIDDIKSVIELRIRKLL